MRLYSLYYISVGSSACFRCWQPSSEAGTAVITASGTRQLGPLPSAVIVESELNNENGSGPGWPVPEAVITAVPAADDGRQHPKHVALSTEM